MLDSVVSPSPIGAARVVDWWHTEDGTEYSAGFQKPAPAFQTVISATAPVALTAKDGVTAIAQGADGLWIRALLIGGAWVRALHIRGSVVYRPRFSLVTARPAAQFQRAIGRCVWEAVCHWDVAPGAGVDSGLGFYPANHGRLLATSREDHGMLIGNVAGVLSFASRGAGGYEVVDLSAYANPLADWNRIGLQLQHATRDTDATVTALVNGVPAVVRTYAAGHKLPVHVAATGAWYPAVTHAEVASYLKLQGLHFYAGPDVERL